MCKEFDIEPYKPKCSKVAADWPHLNGLVLADSYFYSNAPIDLLLGVDFYQYIIEGTTIKGPPGTPVAMLTSLCWLLLCSSGNTDDVSMYNSNHVSIEGSIITCLKQTTSSK